MGTATFVFDTAVSVPSIEGNQRVSRGTVTMSATYATGGDALNFAQVGGVISPFVATIECNQVANDLLVDLANNTIIAIVRATGVEVANGVDIATITGSLEIRSER